ncbi:hypothetical protein [Listeria monocytogenes]|uniref:hypothetical protein n=1 Tax=Listeria monocytogenes TaxID=1639 RepID=UPI0037E0EB57|nr:hypothetical protein [Listeria monocytogenes]
MEESIHCPKCSNDYIDTFLVVEVNEAFFNCCEIKCDRGHKFRLAVFTPKSDYLFQNAIKSFNENNYSECFLMLYSGYESYMKMFVSAFYYHLLRDMDAVDSVLKSVKTSERIKGAFFTAYASLFNEICSDKVENKHTSLRNKVVHQGYLPSETECLNMGNDILDLVLKVNDKYLQLSLASQLKIKDFLDYNRYRMEHKLKKYDISLNTSRPLDHLPLDRNIGIYSPGSQLEKFPEKPFSGLIEKK